ncbi:class I SAM-dependent methyltransferase [Nocardioides sp. Kera G14]|uniref:class I SAM-dependent methyltransferase n=1 Tax=Nocardioides sp. Kera G14 TaxID=2884264 RepID=UPI001D11C221|nr:class I SAM-dependent methyltransferase [Nocardioides sp. Kera G14]UDY22150.1 class I SAM-dependent methyltransferase [Nocardioides sp. Kera G14]
MTELFADTLATWRAYTETPWARIRYAVAADVLARQAQALMDTKGRQKLRVLDVGGGDGMDALPLALAGHEVTIVDPTVAWLEEAKVRAASAGTTIRTDEGGLDDLPEDRFDLVLCHFVLRYRPASAGDLAALAKVVAPGGRLSVMDVNPDGRVLRALINSGPEAALTELHSDMAKVVTFDAEVRKVGWAAVEAALVENSLRSIGLFGNRIANDLVVDDTAKQNPAYFEQLLALELQLSGREPFNRIGFAWQLIAERPA